MNAKQSGHIKPKRVVPYTLREDSEIMAACDRSRVASDGARARAMVLLLRYTGLRISEICRFRKDAVLRDGDNKTWRVLIRTQKSGRAVYLSIPEILKLSLDALPLPRGGDTDCPYYFWNATTPLRMVVEIARRTLAVVFRESDVEDAHAHRYRLTLATRLFEQGTTFEEIAEILGTPAGGVARALWRVAAARAANQG
jgi:integrase